MEIKNWFELTFEIETNLEEINKDEDHIIIDIPINKGYNLL